MHALVDADLVDKIPHYWLDGSGYPLMSVGHQKQQLVHRFVVENSLGRKLTAKEHVHHLDGTKLNNTRNNLVVCSAKYHMLIHARTDMLLAGFHPDVYGYCSACKSYHKKEEFPKNKNAWNGIHNMCKETANAARRGKNYSVFEWRERMYQQFRRAIKKGLVSSLTKEGRCL